MMGLILDYNFQWSIILALCMFFFCVGWVNPRFGVAASLLFAACSYSSIWMWTWTYNRYYLVTNDVIDNFNQQAIKLFACDSLAKIMIIVVPMMLLSERRLTLKMFGEFAAAGFVCISSLLALYQAFRYGCNGLNCGGMIGNASISMGLMVCLLPIFIHSWKLQWGVLVIAALAVILSKSSIGAGLLAAYAGLWLFPWKLEIKRVAISVVAAIGVLGIAKLSAGNELLNDSDRFAAWKYMFYRWSLPWNYPMGTGLGTYHVLSANLQHMHGSVPSGFRENYWWLTLHNDWLQMLFECGVVGAALLCFAYFSALIKTLREQDYGIALSIVLYGLYMFLDPALHNPIPVLFGAWLFVYALRKNQLEVYQ